MMNEASKQILLTTVKEWMKFSAERDKLTTAAQEVAAITAKVLQEALAVLKEQQLKVECDSPMQLKIMGVPVVVEPVIEETFPTVKASVLMSCGEAHRTILINSNLAIAAGGNPFPFDHFKKGIPDSFSRNAAEFARDAFLHVARTGGKSPQKEEPPPPAH